MNYDRPGYLLYQTVHGKPLTVAYISRDDPRTLTERVPVLQHFRHLGPDIIDMDPAQIGPTVLQDLGVGTVVLDRYKMPGGKERDYTEQLAQTIFAGQSPIFEDERITSYKAPPVEQPRPYVSLGPLNWGPYQLDAQNRPYRLLSAGPAQLELHHVQPGARLHIQYRTESDSGLKLFGADGSLLAALEPAPDGATFTLGLEPILLPHDSTLAATLVLQPNAPDAVRVERLWLD